MRSTPFRRRALPASFILASMLTVTACGGGFGGDEEEGGDNGGDGATGTAGASGPDLSEPPEIEGEVISDGESYEIKYGIGLAEDSPQALSVDYFADILDERSDGRITVSLFPNSQVGDDLQMMNNLQSGTLEMTMPSTSPATSIVPELQLFDLPFLFPTPEEADAVLDGEIGQSMLDSFEGSGIKGLAFAENGYRQLTNSQHAVSSPEDVQGLDIRVMENPIQVSIWETLGANPTSMAFGEVFSALEQGVVDGQENPWSTILTSRFNEVQDYASETRHVYSPFIIMIGEEFYNGLSEEDQQLIQEAAEQSRDYQRQISREMDTYSKEQLASQGMEVTELSEEELAAFQEATQPVYEQWRDEIGGDLIDSVQEELGQR
ncbi:TRAP transporter substrate-binding protein [Ornithinicoccus halotolerans]|uniref:TRAP transporter substrate-binding protein n=1 Tax=Ornithinicoccus halotolerans TaxID=1748220 RepID=UPI001E30561F|nr:TRAP transporter substrate-binding protein [Ornithinicoccus halotolerans]